MRRLVVASLIVGGISGGHGVDHLDHVVRPTPHQIAVAAYQRMSPAERVGQLFMAGVPSSGTSPAQRAFLRRHSVGNVILDHNTSRSSATIRAKDTKLATQLRFAKVSPFISTDQEGGLVQRLRGKGFAAIPDALHQGSMNASALKAAAATWGSQLAAAKVNLNLAPIADTVPAKHAKQNQPIGQFDREFAHTPAGVGRSAVAFARGMNAGGVQVTVKHFPGLGRASGNTDLTPHVTDPTTRHDPYLQPFVKVIKAGASFVMVSSATYPHIDASRPACFSSTIMRAMLRGDDHFDGVVISDDLGTSALAHLSLGKRATKFFNAGGTMLLDTSVGQLPRMIAAVQSKAAASPGFAATVKTDVLTVLTTKASSGLISG